jgi:hypothetical protein
MNKTIVVVGASPFAARVAQSSLLAEQQRLAFFFFFSLAACHTHSSLSDPCLL